MSLRKGMGQSVFRGSVTDVAIRARYDMHDSMHHLLINPLLRDLGSLSSDRRMWNGVDMRSV